MITQQNMECALGHHKWGDIDIEYISAYTVYNKPGHIYLEVCTDCRRLKNIPDIYALGHLWARPFYEEYCKTGKTHFTPEETIKIEKELGIMFGLSDEWKI
jgi:hypothetical protein